MNYVMNKVNNDRIWNVCQNFATRFAFGAESISCRLFDIYCSYEALNSGVSHSSQRWFLSQPTFSAASLANNAFHSLPLLCFLSFVSATHLMLIWQPPQCTIESSWPEITLGKGSRSALQLCWRQWHNSNTNQGAGFKTRTTTSQPGWA